MEGAAGCAGAACVAASPAAAEIVDAPDVPGTSLLTLPNVEVSMFLPIVVVCARRKCARMLGKAPTPKGALLPQRIVSYMYLSVTRKKQHRPGIPPNANTTHVPSAGSSAAPTKPNHTPTRHPRAKGKLLLQIYVLECAASLITPDKNKCVWNSY